MTEHEHGPRFEVPNTLNQMYFNVAYNALGLAADIAKQSMDQARRVQERMRILEEKLRQALEQIQILEEKVEIDSLSNVLNREAFVANFERALVELNSPPRSGSPDAIVLIVFDGDRFKAINDGFGHPAGDNVLRVTGDALHMVRQDEDAAARLGGDEFMLQLSVYQAQDVELAVHAVMKRFQGIANELLQDEQPRPDEVSFSYGWVSAERGEDASFESMYQQADAKLYEIKQHRDAEQ